MKEKTQTDKFKEAAQQVEADESETAFDAALKKIATAPKPIEPVKKSK